MTKSQRNEQLVTVLKELIAASDEYNKVVDKAKAILQGTKPKVQQAPPVEIDWKIALFGYNIWVNGKNHKWSDLTINRDQICGLLGVVDQPWRNITYRRPKQKGDFVVDRPVDVTEGMVINCFTS